MKVSFWTRVVDCLVIVLINICVIVMGIWLSAIPIAKSKTYYIDRYKENPVAIKIINQKFPGVDVDEAIDKIAGVNIDYFFGNLEEYQVEINGVKLFNEYEVRHMKDVKDLFIVGQILACIFLFILIACVFYACRYFRRLRKVVVNTTLCFYGVVIILLGLFVLWGYNTYMTDEYKEYNTLFTYLFINFHKIIFFYDYDKFLLATSQEQYSGVLWTMTRFMNSDFFMEIGIRIAITVGVFVLLWVGIIITYYIMYPKICRKIDEIHERAKEFNQTEHSS